MSPTTLRRLLPALTAVLVTTIGAAPAQTECPPQSNAPQCAGEDPAPAAEPGDQPTRGERPTTPPGQGQEPATREPAPTQPPDPRPDNGADRDTDTTPGSPPGTTSGTTSDPAGGSSGGRPGRDDTAARPTDAETGEPIPPPPPDLGPRRVLVTRLAHGPAGPRLEIDVAETRARGVDGGWTVTISGPDAVATVVDARARRPDGPVGLAIGRVPSGPGGSSGFSVVGQRSTTVYDADYGGRMPLAPLLPSPPPVIVVTLFQ